MSLEHFPELQCILLTGWPELKFRCTESENSLCWVCNYCYELLDYAGRQNVSLDAEACYTLLISSNWARTDRLPSSWAEMDSSQSQVPLWQDYFTELYINQQDRQAIDISSQASWIIISAVHTPRPLNHPRRAPRNTDTAEEATTTAVQSRALDGASECPLGVNSYILGWLQNVLKHMQCYLPLKIKKHSRQRQAHLREFKASLLYIVSLRSPEAT